MNVKFKNNSKGPMIGMLLAMALLLICIVAYHIHKSNKLHESLENQKNILPTVSTAKVSYVEWEPRIKTFGSLRAVQGVNINPELGGLVTAIYFNDGQNVNKDDHIIQIFADDDIALLEALEAAAKLAEVTYERDKAQYEIQVVSKEQLDMDFYNMLNQKALAKQQKVIVEKKTIRAPFDGKLGIRAINLGDFLNPGDPIVTLQSLDPLYVDFKVPELYFENMKVGEKVTLAFDAYPNRKFEGTIHAISPLVDASNRNLTIEGIVDNQKNELLPGMYANVEVTTGSATRHLSVPQTAVTYNPYGNIVYLVVNRTEEDIKKELKKKESENEELEEKRLLPTGPDSEEEEKDEEQNENISTPGLSVELRFVTLGETRGDQVVILKGLKEGDEIVTSGQLKLKNHSRISINNEVMPTNDLNPNIKDE